MRFDDFLDVLCAFLKNPVIYVRSSDSDDVAQLRQQLASCQSKIETLKKNLNVIQERYIHECDVNMALKDKLSFFEKE